MSYKVIQFFMLLHSLYVFCQIFISRIYNHTMSATKIFIRQNKVNVAIFMFLILFSLVHYLKPGLIYTKEGGFREFGVGYRNKTVIPAWLISIILAILCYFVVIYYLAYF